MTYANSQTGSRAGTARMNHLASWSEHVRARGASQTRAARRRAGAVQRPNYFGWLAGFGIAEGRAI